jgi:hypothetical protein
MDKLIESNQKPQLKTNKFDCNQEPIQIKKQSLFKEKE